MDLCRNFVGADRNLNCFKKILAFLFLLWYYKCRTCKSLAAVAQVVERRLGKAEVTGSSLVSSFTIKIYFKTRLEFTFARLCIACKDRFSGMSYFFLYYSKNKLALYDMFLNIYTFIFIYKEYFLVFYIL